MNSKLCSVFGREGVSTSNGIFPNLLHGKHLQIVFTSIFGESGSWLDIRLWGELHKIKS